MLQRGRDGHNLLDGASESLNVIVPIDNISNVVGIQSISEPFGQKDAASRLRHLKDCHRDRSLSHQCASRFLSILRKRKYVRFVREWKRLTYVSYNKLAIEACILRHFSAEKIAQSGCYI